MPTAGRFQFDSTVDAEEIYSEPVSDLPPVESHSYPAKRLSAGALFCPDCRVRLDQVVPVCPSCGFTGARTLNLFPSNAPAMHEWMDQAVCWNEGSRKKILQWLKRLRRRFPQIHWCLLSISLPEDVRLRLFNFWFLNVSPVADAEEAERRTWTILLTYDVTHDRMAVTPGYQIEPLLADDDWEDLLITVKSFARERGVLRGYLEFFREAEKKLVEASRRMNDLIEHREGGRNS